MAQRVARPATKFHNDRRLPFEVQCRRSSHDSVEQRLSNASRQKIGPRLNCGSRVSRIARLAILWLQNADVPASRDVERVASVADEEPIRLVQRCAASAHRAREKNHYRF